MPDHPLLLALVENWHALVLVGLAGVESLIDENQQCVSDSHDSRCLLSPRLGGNPPELVLDEAILLGRGGPGALRQGASQPPVTTCGVTTSILACTPIVSFVSWLHPLRFLSGCNPSYGVLTLAPVGLSPTEHASLRWSHYGPKTGSY